MGKEGEAERPTSGVGGEGLSGAAYEFGFLFQCWRESHWRILRGALAVALHGWTDLHVLEEKGSLQAGKVVARARGVLLIQAGDLWSVWGEWPRWWDRG